MEKLKAHIEKHKLVYACTTTGVVVAGITWVIMRSIASQHISRGIAVAADRGIAVVADRSVVTNNVSYISSRRQGSPSWVIRCIETGEIKESQRAMALLMDLFESDLSQHLNGRKPDVNGYHFERICLAA